MILLAAAFFFLFAADRAGTLVLLILTFVGLGGVNDLLPVAKAVFGTLGRFIPLVYTAEKNGKTQQHT